MHTIYKQHWCHTHKAGLDVFIDSLQEFFITRVFIKGTKLQEISELIIRRRLIDLQTTIRMPGELKKMNKTEKTRSKGNQTLESKARFHHVVSHVGWFCRFMCISECRCRCHDRAQTLPKSSLFQMSHIKLLHEKAIHDVCCFFLADSWSISLPLDQVPESTFSLTRPQKVGNVIHNIEGGSSGAIYSTRRLGTAVWLSLHAKCHPIFN